MVIRGIWIHPWDLVEAGAHRVLGELRALGFSHASMAVRYVEEKQAYPGPGVIYRNPGRRLYVSEEDVVYWSIDESRFSELPPELRPRRSRDIGADAVKAFTEAAQEHGLSPVLWLPVLRSGSTVRASPRYGARDLYGGIAGYKRHFMCPSNPAVRRLVELLVEDLCTRYEFSELELDYIRYPHPLSTIADPRLVLHQLPCFCSECRRRAEREGVDLDAVARRLRELAEESIVVHESSGTYCREGDTDCVSSMFWSLLGEAIGDTLLSKWIEFRCRIIAEVVALVRDKLRSYSRGARLSADLVPPSRSWLVGQCYRILGELLDTVKIMVYTSPFGESPSRIPYEIAWARRLLPGGTRVVAGIALWPPQTPWDIARDLRLVSRARPDGVYFYAYGWAPRANLLEASRLLKEGVE